jgi:hypothetical protein
MGKGPAEGQEARDKWIRDGRRAHDELMAAAKRQAQAVKDMNRGSR